MTDKITRELAVFGMSVIAAPIVMVAATLYGAYAVFASGYVLSCLWAWYAVPLGAVSLSWKTFTAGVIALRMMRPSTATPSTPPEDKEKKKAQIAVGIAGLAKPWFALALGWFLR